MGSLISAEAVVMRAIATAIAPPPPPDITRWCEENIEFDDRSPMPGPFRIERFPFLREIHQVLSPEHAAREVTIRGSAQWGKTVSIINPTIGAWHEYGPLDSLVVHPTHSAATEWVDNKWLPMRRESPSLLATFGTGRGGDNKDAKFNQETLSRNGSLKITSAGSPDDLAGTSRRLVILDDLAKFEMTPKGDPEFLAESRASGFEDAKIARVSTPQELGTCRISKAYDRSDQRLYYVPCPHCGHEAPLTWENFLASIDPERLGSAHFTCDRCKKAITHDFKEQIVRAGRWVPQNPAGDHPGFHLWRAYAPQRDWASIAMDYARVMGWSKVSVTGASAESMREDVEDETEQTFWNDVLGLPYERETDAPKWEDLRNRVENAEIGMVLDRGVVPSCGVLLTGGVDCQDDRIELEVVAFGPNKQRWVVDYVVIPYHIGTQEGRDALDSYLAKTWLTSLGLPLQLDALAIDGGTYSDDVWSWATTHADYSRVIVVKGSSSQSGSTMVPMKYERRKDGKAKRRQKRGFILNVSQMKGDFFAHLKKEDPEERGYVHFARGFEDEVYRMITSEVRVLVRSRTGVVTSKWDLVEPSRRNEALDAMNYAEAAARRKGWVSMTEAQWDELAAKRGVAPEVNQLDLFEAASRVVADAHPSPSKSKEQKTRPRGFAGVAYDGN